MAIVPTFDTIWCSAVALPATNLALLGHPRSCSMALSRAIPLRSAHMLRFSYTAVKDTGPLESADKLIEKGRYVIVECSAAGRPRLDLSDQL